MSMKTAGCSEKSREGYEGSTVKTFFKKLKKLLQNLLTFSDKSCIISPLRSSDMREWRNWQTRTFEGRVVHTVRVQVPFLAPKGKGAAERLLFLLVRGNGTTQSPAGCKHVIAKNNFKEGKLSPMESSDHDYESRRDHF